MVAQASLPASYALHLLSLVPHQPFADPIIASLGLCAEELRRPGARISASVFSTLIQRAIALSGQAALGVIFGSQVRIMSHGALGVAALTACTVDDAFAVMERFMATRSTILMARRHVDGPRAVVEFIPLVPLDEVSTEFLMLSTMVMCFEAAAYMTQRPLALTAEVALPEPSYVGRYPCLRGVRFSQKSHRLILPTEQLCWPLLMHDPVTTQLARAECTRELAALGDPSDLLRRVRQTAVSSNGRYRSLAEIARGLGVSPRTLKRRLADRGTTLSDVTDNLRRERALQLLDDRRLDVDAVAEATGYSDVASFARAFRRWQGMTPTQYRNR